MSIGYDVIVVGLGAMGSASTYQLARRGQRVLGLDRFTPPHAHGSSLGETRIIREAYFEHPSYVPLLQRAYELWAELEQAAGKPIFRPTGGLMIGRPDSGIVTGALRSAREHGLRHELLTAREIRRRFPALQPADDMVGVHEPRAGMLFPEQCIEAYLRLARAAGAELRLEQPVLRWKADAQGVEVTGANGTWRARQLVVTAGAWVRQLISDWPMPVQIERQVLHWFEPLAGAVGFGPAECPVHLWQFDGDRFFYGFPRWGDGVKVARHHAGEITTPETLDRSVSTAEVDAMRAIVRRFLPGADGVVRRSSVCMYTNTPDGHFWIDRHPGFPNVWVASPCSGHGFKFASVIGEIVSDLVLAGASRFDLDLFRARRFSG